MDSVLFEEQINHIYYWYFQRSPEFMFMKGSSWDLSYASYWVQMHLGGWETHRKPYLLYGVHIFGGKGVDMWLQSFLYEVLDWKRGTNWGIHKGSERHVAHMGFDISGWEAVPPWLPGPFEYPNGRHLWEGTGVTDTTVLMRGAGPVMGESHSMKWTPSRGQRRRKRGRTCTSQSGSWSQETSLNVSNTSKGGLDPFKVDG